MTRPDAEVRAVMGTAEFVSTRAGLLLAASVGFLAFAAISGQATARLAALVAGLTLVALVLLARAVVSWLAVRHRRETEQLFRLMALDASPCFTTDEAGQLFFRNAAAEALYGSSAATLLASLHDRITTPAAVLQPAITSIGRRCRAGGFARTKRDIAGFRASDDSRTLFVAHR